MQSRSDQTDTNEEEKASLAWDTLLKNSRQWSCLYGRARTEMPNVTRKILSGKGPTKEEIEERDWDGMGECIGTMFVKSAGVSAHRLQHPFRKKNEAYREKVLQLGERTIDALSEQGQYCHANRMRFWSAECRKLEEVKTEIERFTQALERK